MKKKIVLFILLFLFCITGVKAAPSASDNYAIGDNGYETFDLALAAAGNTQTTITLLKDLGDNITIPEGKNIILDLGNHTLRNTSANATVIVNNGTLVITNGTVTSDKKSGMINNNSSGKLTINDGNYIATGKRQSIYNDGGTLNIGGTAKLESSTNERATLHNLNNGTINITSGTIIAKDSYAIYNENGLINIGTKDYDFNTNTPKILGKNYGIIAATSYNFYDGIIGSVSSNITGKVTKTGLTPTYVNDGSQTLLNEMEDDSVKKDGTYTDTDSGKTYNTLYGYIDPTNRITITFDPTGGTISTTYKKMYIGNPVGELPVPERNDYEFDGWFTEEYDGTQINESTLPIETVTYYAHWTYVDPNTAASVDGIPGLMSLADACAIGGNIKLERDVIIYSPLVMNKEAVLDLNGHTITLKKNNINITEKVTIVDSSNPQTGKITSNANFSVIVGKENESTNGHLIHKGGTIEGLGLHGAIYNYETTEIDGGTVQGTATGDKGFVIYNEKTLIIKDGTVYSTNGRAIQVYENSTFTMDGGLVKSDATHDQTVNLYGNCSAVINGGRIEGLNEHTAGIAMFENTDLTVNGGTIIGYDMAVAGNGNEHSGNANITINGGDLIATNGVAMYLPQRNSVTTINGGNISGPTGIEIRASKLYINGGNITGTSNVYNVGANASGTTSVGAALAVSQHNTKLPIEVVISGGNLQALVPVVEANPMNNSEDDINKVSVIILNGNFISTGTEVIDAEDPQTIIQAVSGGIYTYDPIVYVKDGYGVVTLPDNRYEVTKIHNVIIDSDSSENIATNADKYPYKSVVDLNVTNKDGYNTIIKVLDENGNQIEVKNNSFVMPDSDVTISVSYEKIEDPVIPKTGDNVLSYILLLEVAIIGLLCTRVISLNRKDV
ncbi:MAG: InlB B-repeat-containing protein [Bacilli bacterium]|nr:InlB B-repeat-containing protein [Bacilli bacterium]